MPIPQGSKFTDLGSKAFSLLATHSPPLKAATWINMDGLTVLDNRVIELQTDGIPVGQPSMGGEVL